MGKTYWYTAVLMIVLGALANIYGSSQSQVLTDGRVDEPFYLIGGGAILCAAGVLALAIGLLFKLCFKLYIFFRK